MGLISRVSSRTYRSQTMSKAQFESILHENISEITKNFDDSQIRTQCKQFGLKPGPFPTPSIRNTWIRRLAMKITENELVREEETSSGSDYEESEREAAPQPTDSDPATATESDEQMVAESEEQQ